MPWRFSIQVTGQIPDELVLETVFTIAAAAFCLIIDQTQLLLPLPNSIWQPSSWMNLPIEMRCRARCLTDSLSKIVLMEKGG